VRIPSRSPGRLLRRCCSARKSQLYATGLSVQTSQPWTNPQAAWLHLTREWYVRSSILKGTPTGSLLPAMPSFEFMMLPHDSYTHPSGRAVALPLTPLSPRLTPRAFRLTLSHLPENQHLNRVLQATRSVARLTPHVSRLSPHLPLSRPRALAVSSFAGRTEARSSDRRQTRSQGIARAPWPTAPG
jgi:hypothetical protein